MSTEYVFWLPRSFSPNVLSVVCVIDYGWGRPSKIHFDDRILLWFARYSQTEITLYIVAVWHLTLKTFLRCDGFTGKFPYILCLDVRTIYAVELHQVSLDVAQRPM